MHTVEIKLEGITGYSTAKEFEDDSVWLQLGGNTDAVNHKNVGSIQLKSFDAYIVGGPEFCARIMECKTGGKWDGVKLFKLGYEILIDHFREDRRDFVNMMTHVREEAFELGVQAARKKMRAALGIEDTREGYCVPVQYEIETEI